MKTQKSRIILSALALVSIFALAGCTEPIQLKQDPIATPPQIHLTRYGLQNDIYGEVLPVHRVGAGQLDVAVRLYNKTGQELQVDYQYRFLDQGGAEIESPSGWHAMRIAPKGWAEAKFTSMTAQAADFDLDVRPVR